MAQADWGARREIVRALVKRIDIGAEEVRIVYRVAPVPFVEAPTGGVLQHCQKHLKEINRPSPQAHSPLVAPAFICSHCSGVYSTSRALLPL